MNAAASNQSVDTGAAAFVTTHWSVVLVAQGESPSAQEALEKLCRIYWWPLYRFVRRQGYTPEEAQDLTQGFFAMLLERRDFESKIAEQQKRFDAEFAVPRQPYSHSMVLGGLLEMS
jgi:hypothetical protein